jgi:hypothetical protein
MQKFMRDGEWLTMEQVVEWENKQKEKEGKKTTRPKANKTTKE